MAIPLRYNLRNLVVRWVTTLMTIAGIGLVTLIFVMFFALAAGLDKALVGTGHPLNMIVLRPNATETQSDVSKQQAADIAAMDGIEKAADGAPLASAELVTVANVVKVGGGKANVAIRGVGPKARDLRDRFRLQEGRWFRPSLGEVVVGRGASNRFQGLRVGDSPFIRGRAWTVVGIFEADGQVYESEIWADVLDVQAQFKRDFSTVLARCKDAATIERLGTLLKADKQIQLEGRPHANYYKDQNMMANMMRAMGVILAIVVSIGAIFGAANTMYAAVSIRTKEIATMRVLGYTRLAVWLSFVFEAAILGLCGGAVGSVAGRLIFDGMTTGTANWETFSEIAFQFRVTPSLMAAGVVLAMGVGMVGGFFPALRASRKTISIALRGG